MLLKNSFNLFDILLFPLRNIDFIKGIGTKKNIIYFDKEKDICKLDIYYKKHLNKYPVILNIHGGAFVAGDKRYRKSFSKDLASSGCAVVNINYGLAPSYPFPHFINQAVKALEWIYNNADVYNFDINNIFVSGDSSGAFIAAYLGALQTNESLRKKLNINNWVADIKGLILFCGIYNAEELLDEKFIFNLQSKLGSLMINYPKEFISDRDKIRDFKYYDLLNLKNLLKETYPSTFLTYTDYDVLCPNQGHNFHKQLNDLNIKVSHHHATRKKDYHCYHSNRLSRVSRQVMKLVKSFINDNLFT